MTTPQPPDLTARPDTRFIRLDEVAACGISLAKLVEAQANRLAIDESARVVAEYLPQLTHAYDGVARSVRQTIALEDRLRHDINRRAAAADHAEQQRRAVRRNVIRGVEDAIADDTPAIERENVLRDLYERLDDPDFDAIIATTDPDCLIDDLISDLGIVAADLAQGPRRRSLTEIAVVGARSARRSGLSAAKPVVLRPLPHRASG